MIFQPIRVVILLLVIILPYENSAHALNCGKQILVK